MKKKRYGVWQVIYPIGMYYVVSSLVFFMLGLFFGEDNSTYMLRQMFCSAATIPFILSFYREDKRIEDTVYGKKEQQPNGVFLRNALLSIAAAASLGIAVNNMIAMTPLMEASVGFKEANEAFFGGTFLMELFGSCFVVPIAEELLFRGVILGRIHLIAGEEAAVIISALLFGVVHVNLVQFLYASVIGILLAYLVRKTGSFAMAVFGHMTANLAAVVRAETGWLDFSYQTDVAGIGFTLVMAGAAIAAVWYLTILERPKE